MNSNKERREALVNEFAKVRREECEHGRLKRVCPLCELQDELGLALTEVGRLEDQLTALREENERLRNELRCICENDSRKLDEIKRLRAAHKPCPCCDAYWAEIPRPEGE
jgi:hypothetical protein